MSGGFGEHAALFRIEHAGRLVAQNLLVFLDRLDHAFADVAGDGAVILADPGEVGLDRLTFGLGHRIGGVGGLLHGGPAR
jgi:hypothetical protein